MHGFLGFIRYSFGVIFYILYGLMNLFVAIIVGELISITLGLEEYEAWEPVATIRLSVIGGVIAFIFYWIGRFLTRDYLTDILENTWEKIRYFSR